MCDRPAPQRFEQPPGPADWTHRAASLHGARCRSFARRIAGRVVAGVAALAIAALPGVVSASQPPSQTTPLILDRGQFTDRVGFVATLKADGESGVQPMPVDPTSLSPPYALAGRLEPAATPATAEPTHEAQFITAWNETVVETAYEVDQWFTLLGHRTLAMMHLAMHDALNAIAPRYETYALDAQWTDAHPVAAASQAAHDVARAAYPDHAERFAALHARLLADVPDNARAERGLALGAKTAAAIIAAREGDAFDAEVDPYSPESDAPGVYQFTEPHDFAAYVEAPHALPFVMRSADQFRVPPPPALDSETYATDLNEVAALGRRNSTERTPDQTHIAHWWAEFCESWCARLARKLVAEHNLDAWDAARLFALLHVDNFDGYLTNFESKYHYAFWRPVTAIRAADDDGNDATASDPDWEPEMETLPHPDYPSAHAQACTGAAAIFEDAFGTADLRFTMDSATAPEQGPATRSYDNIHAAAEDCGLSRLYNGFHFRFAIDAGAQQGRERAAYVLATILRPLDAAPERKRDRH